MEQNKRRNSILRSASLRDDYVDHRLKRRISFNEIKSVREFCREEKPTALNKPYEISEKNDGPLGKENQTECITKNTHQHYMNNNVLFSSTHLEDIDKSHHSINVDIGNSFNFTLQQIENQQREIVKNRKSEMNLSPQVPSFSLDSIEGAKIEDKSNLLENTTNFCNRTLKPKNDNIENNVKTLETRYENASILNVHNNEVFLSNTMHTEVSKHQRNIERTELSMVISFTEAHDENASKTIYFKNDDTLKSNQMDFTMSTENFYKNNNVGVMPMDIDTQVYENRYSAKANETFSEVEDIVLDNTITELQGESKIQCSTLSSNLKQVYKKRNRETIYFNEDINDIEVKLSPRVVNSQSKAQEENLNVKLNAVNEDRKDMLSSIPNVMQESKGKIASLKKIDHKYDRSPSFISPLPHFQVPQSKKSSNKSLSKMQNHSVNDKTDIESTTMPSERRNACRNLYTEYDNTSMGINQDDCSDMLLESMDEKKNEYFGFKLKETRTELFGATPQRKSIPFMEATPHRSLMEFEDLERKEIEENSFRLFKNDDNEIELNETRLSADGTPILNHKKRQTIIFEGTEVDITANDTLVNKVPTNIIQSKTEERRKQRQTILTVQNMCLEETSRNPAEIETFMKRPSRDIFKEKTVDETCTQRFSLDSIKEKNVDETRTQRSLLDAFKQATVVDYLTLRSFKENDIEEDGHMVDDTVNKFDASIPVARRADFNDCEVTEFECNPITVSDVSQFFCKQRQSLNNETPISVNCNSHITQHQCLITEPVESSPYNRDMTPDNNTEHNIELLKNRYINMSNIMGLEDLDDTCLDNIEENIVDLSTDTSMTVAATTDEAANSLPSCKKCEMCQNTMTAALPNDELSDVEIVTATASPFTITSRLDRLKRLRQRTKNIDMNREWRRMSLDNLRDAVNFSFEEKQLDVSNNTENENKKRNEKLISQINDNLHSNKRAELTTAEMANLKASIQLKVEADFRSFADKLRILLKEKNTNWIFNADAEYLKILSLHHNKISEIDFVLTYSESVSNKTKNTTINYFDIVYKDQTKRTWKPIDYLIDFLLKVEFPIHQKAIIETQDLNKIVELDNLCLNIARRCYAFWYIVCKANASLVRKNGNIYVVKKLPTVDEKIKDYEVLKVTEFQIEVTNVDKICYKDIIQPPLHLFHEDIANTPIGHQFLKMFLNNPGKHLKSVQRN